MHLPGEAVRVAIMCAFVICNGFVPVLLKKIGQTDLVGSTIILVFSGGVLGLIGSTLADRIAPVTVSPWASNRVYVASGSDAVYAVNERSPKTFQVYTFMPAGTMVSRSVRFRFVSGDPQHAVAGHPGECHPLSLTYRDSGAVGVAVPTNVSGRPIPSTLAVCVR